MENLILSQISIQELKTEISDTIKKELQNYVTNLQLSKQLEYLTRKEAAKLLGVTLPTLNDWTKTGVIQGYRIASRIRYKREELDKSLCKIKTQSNPD